MFEAGDAGNHGKLHIQRQAGGNAVGVAFLPVQPFRLDKDVVPLTLGKPRHLVLHGGAVARARAFNDAREQRRAVHARSDGVVRPLVGPRHITRHLRLSGLWPVKAEARSRIVPGLFLHLRKIDGRPEQPRGGPGLEAAQGEAVLPQRIRKLHGGGIAEAPAGKMREPHVDEPAQERARGQDDVRGLKGLPQLGANPGGASAPLQHLVHGILPDGDARLGEQGGLRRLHVAVAVDLRAGGPYGGPLAGVQRAELDTRPVGPQAHHAAEGVDFPDHMPFGEPPDGGVARKVPDAIHIARDQQHALPEPRQRHGGFAARMSRAYDYTIEHKLFLGKKRGRETLLKKGSPSPVPHPSQDFRLVGRGRERSIL